jgi:hypothetical protein
MMIVLVSSFAYPQSDFCIISVYINNLNIIDTDLDINEARDYLKAEFEMKDLGKTKFCLVTRIGTRGTTPHRLGWSNEGSDTTQSIIQKISEDHDVLSKV